MSLTNHGKKTKRLCIFQILWGYLRAFLFCFQDHFKVFDSSTCLHVSLHTPLGNPTPVLAPIVGHENFPAGCGAGFSPPNLVFLEESLQRSKPMPLHYFSVSNGLHTRTKIQRVKAKSKQKYFPQYNYNHIFLTKKKKKSTNRNIFLPVVIILKNLPSTNGRTCLCMSLC